MIAFTAISLCFVRVPHDLAAVEPSDALTFGTGHAGVEVSDNETTRAFFGDGGEPDGDCAAAAAEARIVASAWSTAASAACVASWAGVI